MKKIIQHDLFRDIEMYQKQNIDTAVFFDHDLNERQRMENSENMAVFYGVIIGRLIQKYYLSGPIPLFSNIMFSTINRCNGECSFCGANMYREKREYQKMTDTLMKKIISECGALQYRGRFTMEGLNEPFLDVRMADWIPYIKREVPHARIHIITNGTCLTPAILKKIYPYITKLHINNYNKKISKDIQDCFDAAKSFSDHGNKIKFTMREEHEILSQFGQNECGRTIQRSMECSCILPFNTISILPDGNVNLCISDMMNDFNIGNVNEETMTDIWYGEKVNSYRDSIANGRAGIPLCEKCDMFCF